jgi:hypothetical protein
VQVQYEELSARGIATSPYTLFNIAMDFCNISHLLVIYPHSPAAGKYH